VSEMAGYVNYPDFSADLAPWLWITSGLPIIRLEFGRSDDIPEAKIVNVER